MNNKILFTGLASALLATTAFPALAQNNEANVAAQSDTALTAAINHERRSGDKARDMYRHPSETLAFFQVTPDQTVAEYAPGGGWYTRVLLPYLSDNGTYVAINSASDKPGNSWAEGFPAKASEWTAVPAGKIAAYESDDVAEELKGKVDRILIFRSLHGLLNANRADSELRALRDILADDGMVGVVQHRANADAPYAMSNGSKGYLRQDNVIKLFELNGFELVDSSEINANPKDTKDYEKGVWALPPTLTNKEVERAKYEAIGESDRMTLLFKKRP
ncbi:methyltransferase [Parasphingorhabdus sp.]|uniref:class I SAM-dependent methyltransferase n=1 Tax=Parasphingorhabdus sp. TaxID=2709688 RepID=UPI002F931952